MMTSRENNSIHSVREYIHAYAQMRRFLQLLNVPIEMISPESHLEKDLGFDRKKKLELTLLMEQEYGIPIDKNQIYRVHDAILTVLNP